MKCLYCNEKEGVKYGKYSSGKFCSKDCAIRYSSNFNREETNKKISKTIKKINPKKYHSCKNQECDSKVIGYKKLYCSDECKKEYMLK